VPNPIADASTPNISWSQPTSTYSDALGTPLLAEGGKKKKEKGGGEERCRGNEHQLLVGPVRFHLHVVAPREKKEKKKGGGGKGKGETDGGTRPALTDSLSIARRSLGVPKKKKEKKRGKRALEERTWTWYCNCPSRHIRRIWRQLPRPFHRARVSRKKEKKKKKEREREKKGGGKKRKEPQRGRLRVRHRTRSVVFRPSSRSSGMKKCRSGAEWREDSTATRQVLSRFPSATCCREEKKKREKKEEKKKRKRDERRKPPGAPPSSRS